MCWSLGAVIRGARSFRGQSLLEGAGHWNIALKDIPCSGFLLLFASCHHKVGNPVLCTLSWCPYLGTETHGHLTIDWHFPTMSPDKYFLLCCRFFVPFSDIKAQQQQAQFANISWCCCWCVFTSESTLLFVDSLTPWQPVKNVLCLFKVKP